MKDAPPPGVFMAGGLALGAAAAMGYWQHYNDNVAAPPRLWLADGLLRERVLPHCSALLRSFAPTPWAANRHAQTILGFMRIHTMRNRYNRQLILTVDGATLGLDWFDGCDGAAFPLPPTAPVLLVLHGINGGSHEGYAKWACAAALARGWRAVVLNYRGCNGLPFTSPRGYAATMSHDVFTAIYSVKARFPSAPLLAVGFSLGGLKLTKYVGEADAGLHPPPPGSPHLFVGSGLVAAAVVSSPVSLGLSAAKLSDPTSVGFLYNLAVAYKLREHISHHRRDIEALSRLDVTAALSQWTVSGIEDRGLPAALGFTDRQQYYEEASSLDYIPLIATPTLILLSEDDPFLGVVPDVECARNPSTLLALTRRGGHVGFVQGAWPLGTSYMDDAVMEFFEATLAHLHGHPSQQTASTHPPLPAAVVPPPPPPMPSTAMPRPEAGTTWVTDAARAGARAAAAVAATTTTTGGRPCAERCCGGAGQQSTGVAGAAAPAVAFPAGVAGGGAGPQLGGSGGSVVVHTSVRPHAAAEAAAAAAVGGSGGGGGGGSWVAPDGAAARVVVGVGSVGQLRLLLQLQQQAEQRRRVRAAAATEAAATEAAATTTTTKVAAGGSAAAPLPPRLSKL